MSLIRKFGNTRVFRYLAIALFAVAYALIYEIFVFPNSFAPAGINGIVTMIQYLFRFKVGYLSLIINLPMLAVAWFVLDRSYALRTLTFTLIFSGTLLVSERLGIAESGIILRRPIPGADSWRQSPLDCSTAFCTVCRCAWAARPAVRTWWGNSSIMPAPNTTRCG